MRTNLNGEPTKAPTTKAQYREQLISFMTQGGKSAQRADYIPRHNPERLPEWSLTQGKHLPARMWQAAQEMVAGGEARVSNGSFESGSVYLVAGDNFPA